ncbi:MAG: MFS transporter [Candidatus Omnitrophota bacterium]|nr:MFS transporter [Candidatus Omnitrophota bacterium]
MFSSLKVRDFRIYWLGMLVSLVGSWIQITAQSWLIFRLTHSAFLLGFVGFLSSIPVFFLALFGGLLADRKNKKNILIWTQTAFMILAFILAVLTQLKLITPVQIMLIAFLNGIVMAFDAPSRQAVVAELVDSRHLMNAIALNSAAFNSARMIGPALAGVLVAIVGMSGCFYINGISFLAVIAALLVINLTALPANVPSGRAFKDLHEAVIFIKNNRALFLLIIQVCIVSLFGVSYVVLMPIFADNILHVGVKGLGFLTGASGAGALSGALILARLGDFKYKGRLLVFSSIAFSLSLIVFGMSKMYWLSLAVLFFTGGFSVLALALSNTLLQIKVPHALRGRLMSFFLLTFAGVMPFGNLIAGSVAQAWGAAFVVTASGVVCATIFIIINTIYTDIWDI